MKSAGTQTKSRQAYDILREMIVSHQFSPQNNWSLRKLAAHLKMSVVPITEALRRLEQEGIIEVRPQRGIIVRQLSARELEEVKLIREGLEIQAARWLAIYHPGDKIRKLRQKAEQIQKLSKAGKIDKAVVADFHLHQELVRATESPLLCERYNQLVILCMNTTGNWNTNEWLTGELRGPSNHLLLIDAIESGDPEKAEQAIRNHIRSGVDLYKELR